MVNLTKIEVIVSSNGPIALFGGGEIAPQDVELALSRAESVVAADGGAARAIDSGRIPDAVIGDFDSLDTRYRDQIPPERLFPIREQDSTDFEKALTRISAPVVLGIGFLGARVDHQLAVFNTLVRYPDSGCILLGAHEIVFHAPPRLSVPLKAGETVSLFPMRPVSGRSQGLEWPIDGLALAPDGCIGTSNRATGDLDVQTDAPGLLVMLPRAALDDVMQLFLSGRCGRWSVPSI
ncbi:MULTISPECIES: thiamine diphosphokinase [unclassified Ruegeria]|uniref:thiamine diphosphokinase n=1 Tax=unclassified Ruegeria TaxID=2625375 RepID=UPI0014887B48|nr:MULTISPECIES: thiamine diphosphokinase [unclassified Ruegeria]